MSCPCTLELSSSPSGGGGIVWCEQVLRPARARGHARVCAERPAQPLSAAVFSDVWFALCSSV